MEKIGSNVKIQTIGVTGNVASGKSTLMLVLKNLGIKTLSVDTILANLYNTNQEIIEKIITLLGDRVLTGGCLDKEKISASVFIDRKKLFALEKLTLPFVLKEIKAFIKNTPGILAIEVPLLFELNLEKLFDVVILVKASKHICEKRKNHSFFSSRWDRFDALEEKEQKAFFCISNNGTKEELRQSTTHVVKELIV